MAVYYHGAEGEDWGEAVHRHGQLHQHRMVVRPGPRWAVLTSVCGPMECPADMLAIYARQDQRDYEAVWGGEEEL